MSGKVLQTEEEILLAEQVGQLKRELANCKSKEFTHEEMECLKEALENYDSKNFSEDFQRGILMKLLYEE